MSKRNKCLNVYAGSSGKSGDPSLRWYNEFGVVGNGHLASSNPNEDRFIKVASQVCDLTRKISSIGAADAYMLSLVCQKCRQKK